MVEKRTNFSFHSRNQKILSFFQVLKFQRISITHFNNARNSSLNILNIFVLLTIDMKYRKNIIEAEDCFGRHKIHLCSNERVIRAQ